MSRTRGRSGFPVLIEVAQLGALAAKEGCGESMSSRREDLKSADSENPTVGGKCYWNYLTGCLPRIRTIIVSGAAGNNAPELVVRNY